ncbi:N-acetylmuramoyl-L-alanine amidase [Xanthomonas graminis]|jgi:N-acetylmuramoyl-L-alanine amidase|uniref:N-acetylmuramoyl-L-alanine amidase n=1 Tax=Xanthomonas graminis TaxID=3390026 RepID=UPI00029CA9CB|nr:N-acetylmuramoyl-L-alanine amidase [Xanthomonas translucens]EKU24420.1 exported N-acetylmuramoyl-L-alanine amidase [Xanthomonas translucens pv. graminis ART-Xtg29]OAX59215.1 N-acetylmuramoyl-L-alanine amidase [Xanthomonas translucens pv. graminis]UKE53074.1 N-acetylmuramoyl-L-alanine amidase [Xanthomonas translucens pv. graminis]WIH07392.1 N-acetylmuramoyl-L-alanine amidase [Xanthomonas translucens pv. graminis]WIH10822.1 N-acetylmuramoyl-L-alanine amidase [Xanthomonas translucens pv. grami
MNRRQWLCLAGSTLLLAPAFASASTPIQLSSCTLETAAGRLRLRLQLQATVAYRLFALSDPERLVIDLPVAAAQLPTLPTPEPGTVLSAIRSGARDDGVRIVLELRRPVAASARWDTGEAGMPPQLLLDLGPVDPAAAAAATLVVPPRTSIALSSRPRVVAIDAGHGGKDPGAVSADALYKKHVAMGVAGRLHQALQADPRYRPTLIRSDDRFVPLHERVVIAHQRKADLFVSIHADAAPNRSAQGASVYALSENGASSALARWIADSENSADQYGNVAERYLRQKDPVLSKVLVDLSMSGTIATSLQFGKSMLGRLQQVTRLHQGEVGQAGFAVLKSPDIPSLLVETGFMSNADDCRRLVSDRHQEELAQSLQLGIDDYFQAFPVHA